MPMRAAMVLTLTMLPKPLATMAGAKAAVSWYGARTLAANAASNEAVSKSSVASGAAPAPLNAVSWAMVGPIGNCAALLIRMSTAPAASARARSDRGSVRSAATKRAEPPFSEIALTTAAPRSVSRPVTTTCAPAAASSFAVSLPMPPVPPVTRAVLPLSSMSLAFPRGDRPPPAAGLGCAVHNARLKMGCPIQKSVRLRAMTTSTQSSSGRLTRKGEATRQRIVAAAAQLIYERGVTEATLEDVRAAAGVSGSQIYHYFADKQALLLAVIEYQTEAVLGLQEPLFGRMDSMEGLRRWRDALVEYQRRMQCRGGCPIGSIGGEVAENNPEARLAVASGFLRWEAAIRAGLSAMHARGELDGDPEDLALAVLAALQGGLLLTQIQRETRPLEIALDAILDHVESRTRRAGTTED